MMTSNLRRILMERDGYDRDEINDAEDERGDREADEARDRELEEMDWDDA